MSLLSADGEAPSLKYFPIAIVAVAMGMWGWTLASQAAVAEGFIPAAIAEILRILATLITLGIYGALAIKAIRLPSAIIEDWNTPPKLAFFPGISIALLLLATGFSATAPQLAEVIWVIAAVLQGILTLSVISSWISHRSFQTGQLSPAWFIPAVGNVVAPVGGVAFGYVELSWLFFSGGMIFWLVLLTLVINRLMFHDPMPERLLPTLVITLAPPSVAFLAYVELTGQVDAFARVVLNVAYVFAMLALIQAPKFRTLTFSITWWALSFPVAALSVASFVFGNATGSGFHTSLGFVVWVFLTVLLSALLYKTAKVLVKGGFFRPEA